MSATALNVLSDKFKSVQILTPTAGYTAGQMLRVGGLIGVIAETKTVGQYAVLIYSCEKILVPKRVGTTAIFSVGDKVYYNESAAADVASTTTYICIGRATKVAIAADTTVEMDLHGDIAA
jgi:predicted RecA/RadA family phage recombinase